MNNDSAIGAPADFDIEYSLTHDYGPPMSEIAIYMTAVTVLEDLCFRDQSAPIPGDPRIPFRSPATWSLPQYHVYLEISSQQVRYAIWGLQLTAGDIRKGGFWPVIARYFWRDQFVGRLDFANQGYPLPPLDQDIIAEGKPDITTNNGVSQSAATDGSGISLNATAAVDFVDGARLTIIPTYRGVPLSPRAVFGAAINAMVLGAEDGPETYCSALSRAEIEIIGKENAAGDPLLKYKSVIRAMSMLMSWMVVMNRFGEIDVQIQRNTVLIGTARIKKRGGSIAIH